MRNIFMTQDAKPTRLYMNRTEWMLIRRPFRCISEGTWEKLF